MPDLMVATGDLVMFEPTFGERTLLAPAQAVLSGTGRYMVRGKPGCLITDLAKVVVPGIPYIAGAHTVPGVGMIQLVIAGADQTAMKVMSGAPVLIKGSTCQAVFIPTAPAMTTGGPPAPDPLVGVPTPGKGRFIVTQVTVKAG
ncbi:hypothetical protein [Burkholderia stagnalis]|uniref:hypothetical protein n=1 Tax=Burkholderia stagnalis TaxID=1503054 RepID=UPI00075740DF|nr:hypothetical protein [Burkholderia stagnalis]KWI28418.1 hypothetical protein WT71_16275 [Burkholderia stagnalis]KWI71005.1 hypothetical protein WT73_14060 [Burkholderia stagnalis]MDY7806689.1 hypothetical protein [Burkholderia stagnalis]